MIESSRFALKVDDEAQREMEQRQERWNNGKRDGTTAREIYSPHALDCMLASLINAEPHRKEGGKTSIKLTSMEYVMPGSAISCREPGCTIKESGRIRQRWHSGILPDCRHLLARAYVARIWSEIEMA
jgi:hypothetical protein